MSDPTTTPAAKVTVKPAASTPATFGYFGPEGTFTQMALQAWKPAEGAPQTAYASVDAALAAVREGVVDAAMVPIENSVEGGVNTTLDALANGAPLVIVGEVLVPITFVLSGPEGLALKDIRAVGTHSHAWAQVRGWMSANLPEAVYVPTLSTASAPAGLADGQPPAGYDAAVSAPVAAANYGLEVLARDIGDNANAVTRFVLVARPGWLPDRTGADKTAVVLFQREDHPGGLLELLEQFAVRGVNLTRLESRPTGGQMGRYCFSIDFEGHLHDERVGETLMGLRRVCSEVRFLGSYAVAGPTAVAVSTGQGDTAFIDARDWLADLRGE